MQWKTGLIALTAVIGSLWIVDAGNGCRSGAEPTMHRALAAEPSRQGHHPPIA